MAAAQPTVLEQLFPLIAIFVFFFFFVIRPQMKKAKAHDKLLSELKRGDEVITTSGILGRIDGLTDEFVTLDISNGVKIKILRRQIASTFKEKQA